MKVIILPVLLFFFLPSHIQAQQPVHPMEDMDMEEEDSTAEHHISQGQMSHSLSLNLPMSRNGSGTSWNPDTRPEYMYMVHTKDWTYMFEGNLFIRYNQQDIGQRGKRGDERWDMPDMLMAMGQRQVGSRGLFHFNTMFSLDALVTGERGYPLLFQSGETADGKPLVDRQHPHDLFSELSVSYAHAINKKADIYLYLAYPGEPALGPVTFMHRASGMQNPDAPLSHHWMDATHTSFGVATVGVRYGRFKLEGSSFTGREPDEDRYGFDKPEFDSRSIRLSYNPDRYWALQVSHGFLRSPEVLHPDEDLYRTTASATYSKQFSYEGFFTTSGVWGMNKQKSHPGEYAVLVETDLRLQRLDLYLRYERVQKSVEDLNLDAGVFGPDVRFPVNAYTFGIAYDLVHSSPLRAAIGTQISIFHAKDLENIYGKNPKSGEVYLRLYPGLTRRHK